jgi:hypothetical protein
MIRSPISDGGAYCYHSTIEVLNSNGVEEYDHGVHPQTRAEVP